MISFHPLHESHFPLLLKWLETPHVKQWWDCDSVYTKDLVQEKYGSYVQGYKTVCGLDKPISGFVIYLEKTPIGYIQLYNAYDFPRQNPLSDLPKSLGSIDIFIGEPSYLGKDIGSKAIKLFLKEYAFAKYNYIFVTPEYANNCAVRTYEKSGFVVIKRVQETFWMVAHSPLVRLSIQDSIALEVTFRKAFLKKDRLWLFGSRANLSKKGGDIDLYIETYIDSVNDAVAAQRSFWINFEEAIGEQRIDIVLNILALHGHLLIYDVAKKEGVRIV